MLRAKLLSCGVALLTVLAALSAASLAGASQPVRHYMPLATSTPVAAGAAPMATNNLLYHNGPVQHVPKVYLVLWGWGGSDPSGESPYLQGFLNNVGGSSWANIDTQYCDGSGCVTNPTGILKGVWADDSGTYPVVPDVYIASEAIRGAQHFGYSADADYIVATPHLHNDAEFGVEYCAWHSTVNSGSNVIAYTDLPYIPDAKAGTCGQNFVNPGASGFLDGVSIVAGHEVAEAITDPHLDAWYDSSGSEIGDKCAWISSGPGAATDITLGGVQYAVQSLWSNANNGCVTHYP
jgi:hypothetical protein